MALSKNGFDVTVVQKGEQYIVSGKDAVALHTKMIHEGARDLVIGELKDGSFTLQKVNAAAAGYSEPKTQATAG
jgi:hypothetical protein